MLAMTTSVFVADRQICLEAGINKHTATPMTPASYMQRTPRCTHE
jgi:CheY-like chemotaxis protein